MFRTEHRQVRALLLELAGAFGDRDAGRGRALIAAVAEATGPYFRYEEEAMYPQLTGIVGDAYVGQAAGRSRRRDPQRPRAAAALVRHGTWLGLPVAVSPSGTPTLTAGRLAGLRQAGARAISLSLDGSTAQIHDRFRGVPGVFGWTLDAWQAATELGLKVQINTTVTGHNLTGLADITALVHRLGVASWSAFLLVPTGRGALLPALTARQAEDVLNFVYDAGEFVPARTTEAHHFRRVVLQREILRSRGANHVAVLGLGQLYLRLRLRQRLGDLGLARRKARRPPANVNAGQGFVFISHLGTVHPSGFLPVAAGSVPPAGSPTSTAHRRCSPECGTTAS